MARVLGLPGVKQDKGRGRETNSIYSLSPLGGALLEPGPAGA